MNIREFAEEYADEALARRLVQAIDNAESNSQQTTLAHVLDCLLEDQTVQERFDRAALVRIRGVLKTLIDTGQSSPGAGEFQFDLSALVQRAIDLGKDVGADRVTPLVFIATCLSNGLLRDQESRRTLERTRAAGLLVDRLLPTNRERSPDQDFKFQSLGFGTDLTAMARQGYWTECPVIGMQRELLNLAISISSEWESVAIVGDPGVGKSSLVYGLAYLLAHGADWIPSDLTKYSIVAISTMDLLEGTVHRGAMEKRLKDFLSFLRSNKTVVPFFDEFHTLLDPENQSTRGIATELKPAMAMGHFRCIGVSTDQEYARFIAPDPAMNSRFSKILVPEPDRFATVQILSSVVRTYLQPALREIDFVVPERTLSRTVDITNRFQRSERQPRKSIQLLKRTLSHVNFEVIQGRRKGTELVESDVARVFSEVSGLPLDEVSDDRRTFYSRLMAKLCASIKGQDHAILRVCSALQMQSTGWANPKRPRGRFLFLGPPGVGKTEMALRLAEEVMKDRGSLIVKPMGEFKGEGARNKFMGADPGYIGFGQSTTVYSRVLMRPYSVVLLDEIEKAHESLSDVLLSVLDGSGEDGQGRTVDFSQCIFIMTSNALASKVGPESEGSVVRSQLLTLGGVFQPPFLDRIDEIVVFSSLDKNTLLQILDVLIDSVRSYASQPLPDSLDKRIVKEEIVDDAIRRAGTISARSLDRAFLDFLKHEFKQTGSQP